MNRKKLDHISNPVRWYEGMPIGPQHLQNAFGRSEDLMRYRFSLLSPYSYGVIDLKIDRELLKSHIFKVCALECIMPDGLEVSYVQELDQTLEIDLSSFQETIQKKSAQLIYLCVPCHKIIANAETKFSRFRASETEFVNDMNVNGESLGIPRYRTNLSLKFDVLSAAEYTSLPIAKVNFDNRFFDLLSYVPPSLFLVKENEILNLCESVLTLVKSKSVLLLQQFKKLNSHSKNSSGNMGRLIHILKGLIPYLENTIRKNFISPYELYSCLIDVYSRVVFFDSNFLQDFVPLYDHNNLLSIFTKICEIIHSYLEIEVPKEYSVHYFDDIDGYFRIHIDENLNNVHEILLGFRKPDFVNEIEFISLLNNILICEHERFISLRESRSLGLERKKVNMDEYIFLNKNIYFFSVETNNIKNKNSCELIVYSNLENFKLLEKNSVIFYKQI